YGPDSAAARPCAPLWCRSARGTYSGDGVISGETPPEENGRHQRHFSPGARPSGFGERWEEAHHYPAGDIATSGAMAMSPVASQVTGEQRVPSQFRGDIATLPRTGGPAGSPWGFPPRAPTDPYLPN